MLTLYVELTDPHGLRHYVLYDNGKVHGKENLAHVFHDEHERQVVTQQLLHRMPTQECGAYRGYAWKHLSHLVLASALVAGCNGTESSDVPVVTQPPCYSAPPVVCDTKLGALDIAGNCRASEATMGALEAVSTDEATTCSQS